MKDNRRQFMKKCLAFGAGGFVFSNRAVEVHIGARQPNIIYVLADDLGYGDLGCYGQKLIKTPNLDRMAAEGMRFTQHYAGTCICAPARCVLLTGLHTGHSFIRDNYATGGYQLPIPAETVTVSKLLKQVGYKCGCIGKWGLGGPDSSGHPNRQGFDHFFGYLGQSQAHEYYPDHLWRNDQKVPLDGKTYSHDLMTEEALDFIRAGKDSPFFLYIPYTIPHTKFQVPDLGQYAEMPWTNDQKTQAAMISRMDRDIGRIINLLKELGIDDNTVMFFTSDNGPHGSSGTLGLFDANGPLRGIKRDVYEGGIRVPFIARWPGRIRGGLVTDHISAFWDFLPTCCELAGGEIPAGIDGISLLPTLLSRPDRQKQHEYLYWEFKSKGGKQALRMGRWKGVRLNVRTDPDPPLELYDLDGDIGETTNIAAANPEIVSQIEQRMARAHRYSSYFPLLYGE